MPNEKKAGKGEVPFVVKKLGEAYDGDLKPTAQVLADLLFGAWPAPPSRRQSPPPPKAEREPKPLRLGAGYEIAVVDENGSERDARARKRKVRGPAIPDAEIVEETKTPCSTCGGNGKLGQPGYEIPCPRCSG